MFELSASEQKLAAVMTVELLDSGHTIQEVSDIVEEVVLTYRRLRTKPPSLLLRIRRLALWVMFPFGK